MDIILPRSMRETVKIKNMKHEHDLCRIMTCMEPDVTYREKKQMI